jgi:CBS domain-containing protein
VSVDDPIEHVVETMRDYHTPRVPVVDGERLVGMLSRAELAAVVPNFVVGGPRAAADR